MKPLLKILLGGFVAFQVLAVAQEWEFFRDAWFGSDEPAQELSPEDRQAAADTVYLTLTLMEHLYLSGGDPRFADRMPASEGVRREMLADVEYLERNRRRQDPVLDHLEITRVEGLGPERVEVRTRERWTIRTLWAEDGSEAEPPRRQVIDGKYLIVRQRQSWRMEGWDFTTGSEAASP